MILRHTTHKLNIEGIIRDGCLDGKFHKREKDVGHVSFELDPRNDILTESFYRLKNKGIKNDYVYLEFDGELLRNDGYEIVKTIEGKPMTKVELKIALSLTDDQYEKIGEYRFIKGKIPLTYLTEESKLFLERNYKWSR